MQACEPRVTGSIPSQGTCLGCGPGPLQGVCQRQPYIDVSFLLFLPPFLLNKIFKINKYDLNLYHSNYKLYPKVTIGLDIKYESGLEEYKTKDSESVFK